MMQKGHAGHRQLGRMRSSRSRVYDDISKLSGTCQAVHEKKQPMLLRDRSEEKLQEHHATGLARHGKSNNNAKAPRQSQCAAGTQKGQMQQEQCMEWCIISMEKHQLTHQASRA